MERCPRVSLVTPLFNQARYIVDAVESVLAQAYPNLEHIVIDGGSADGTLARLTRYPHLRVASEPDGGLADAINKGFRLATGEIWGFLNSDDTLLPGALHRVAREIDPERGRHIVMGRCCFIDSEGRASGLEHPSRFEGHRRVLEVWKGHTIPQPAVFWTPEVWQVCGPMDDRLRSAWIDYDLFCRFSRRYRFHVVDQVLAASRLHPQSMTGRWEEVDRLEESISLSRRYWGNPLRPLYWPLALSLALFRADRVGRARRHLRCAQEAWGRRSPSTAASHALIGAVLAPAVAFYVGVYPVLRGEAMRLGRWVLDRLGRWGSPAPQVAAYLEHRDPWNDGWVGPRLAVSRRAPQWAQSVSIRGWTDRRYLSNTLLLTVRVDDRVIGHHRVGKPGDFAASIPLLSPMGSGEHRVEVEASAWFVPHHVARNGDYRPLSWRLIELEFGRGPAQA
jgi:glycosyltransferase involved in cell wall biosynthesis